MADPVEAPGGPGTLPLPLLFLAKTEPRRAEKKNVLRPGSFVSLGLDDPHPPPPFIWRSAFATALSEQIPSAFSLPLHWPKHSICSIDKCTFCLCYTYNTSLSLFFIKQERISRHLSLGLLVIFVLSLILWPKSSDLLHRRGLAECWDRWNCNLEVSTFSLFSFWLEPGKTINLILVLFCRLYLLRCCLNFLIWNKQALTEISEIIFYRRCHWSGLG